MPCACPAMDNKFQTACLQKWRNRSSRLKKVMNQWLQGLFISFYESFSVVASFFNMGWLKMGTVIIKNRRKYLKRLVSPHISILACLPDPKLWKMYYVLNIRLTQVFGWSTITNSQSNSISNTRKDSSDLIFLCWLVFLTRNSEWCITYSIFM